MEFVKSFMREEEGQDVLEYGLVAGLIALVAYGTISAVSGDVTAIWTSVQTQADAAAALVP
jgi:Flp pilus assembly pilin Flp